LAFTYDVLNLIYKSPAKDKLLSKEPNILQSTIPELIIFKTLQNMRHVYFYNFYNKKIKIIKNKNKDFEYKNWRNWRTRKKRIRKLNLVARLSYLTIIKWFLAKSVLFCRERHNF